MKSKKSKFLLMSAAFALGVGALSVGSIMLSNNAFLNSLANGTRTLNVPAGGYTVTLDVNNKPTDSASFTSATLNVDAPDAEYQLGFAYSSVKAGSGVHAVLAQNSTVKRVGEEFTKGFRGISAVYSGGQIFVKYGKDADHLHVKLLPNDGTAMELAEGYTYAYFELEVKDAETVLTSLAFSYDCSVTENPDVSAMTLDAGEAIVTGLDENYKYGELEVFNVKAKGDGTVTSVKLNGYELQEDTRFGDGCYSYYPAAGDKLEIKTSVDEAYDVNVGVYAVDETTGVASPIGTGTYIISASDVDYSAKWYAKVSAPSITGYTVADGYYPNQDYVKFEKGITPNIKFYYSKLAAFESEASTSLSGAGTEASPYLITSVADWLYLKDNLVSGENHYYKLTKSLDFTGSGTRKYMLGSYAVRPNNGDVAYLTDESAVYFNGTIDGSNCAVRGLNLTADNVEYTCSMGLVSMLGQGGMIKDLSTYGVLNSPTSHHRAGGIAGYNLGTIRNCNSYVDITRTAPNGGTGGIAGMVYTAKGDASIYDCVNYGTITGTGAAYSANQQIGGITGFIGTKENVANILGCQNFGDITAGGRQVGGLLGECSYHRSGLNLSNSKNFGNVTAGMYACGLASHISGITCSDCKNFGNITATKYQGVSGGFFQLANYDSTSLENVDNYGDVELQSLNASTSDQALVGGVVVINLAVGAEFRNLNNYGKILNNAPVREGTPAMYYVGGIMAWTKVTATIEECHNYGYVYSSGGTVAGITAYFSNSDGDNPTLNSNLNIGTIKADSTIVGGIVGDSPSLAIPTIKNCVNAGFIKSAKTGAGGIAGAVRNASATLLNNVNYGKVCATGTLNGLFATCAVSSLDASNVNFSEFVFTI